MIDIQLPFVNDNNLIEKLKTGVKLGKIKGQVDKNALVTFN
jgi:hypothetical protein